MLDKDLYPVRLEFTEQLYVLWTAQNPFARLFHRA